MLFTVPLRRFLLPVTIVILSTRSDCLTLIQSQITKVIRTIRL